MNESSIVKECMLAASKLGAKVFRNQVGGYKLADGRFFRSGLCVGSSDIIGWHSVIITPDMVGKRVAIFMAAEAKTESGRLSPEQANFLRVVKDAGGIAGVVKCKADVTALLMPETKQ